MYEKGVGVPQDHAEAVRLYRLAAADGDVDGQCSLGGMYADGTGVPQDHAEAVRWYRLAADQGGAVAQKRAHRRLVRTRSQFEPQLFGSALAILSISLDCTGDLRSRIGELKAMFPYEEEDPNVAWARHGARRRSSLFYGCSVSRAFMH